MTAALSLADQGFQVHLVEKDARARRPRARPALHARGRGRPGVPRGADRRRRRRTRASRVHTGAEVAEDRGLRRQLRHDADHRREGRARRDRARDRRRRVRADRVPLRHERARDHAARARAAAGRGARRPAGGALRDDPVRRLARGAEPVLLARLLPGRGQERDPDQGGRPAAQVFILYRDIRTYGLREDYYRKARELGVLFVRYDVERKPVVAAGRRRADGAGLRPDARPRDRDRRGLGRALDGPAPPPDDGRRRARCTR